MSDLVRGEKYMWLMPGELSKAVVQLAKTYTLSTPIMQTLVGRGLATRESLDEYLFAVDIHSRWHPSLLHDAQRAVSRLLYAIEQKERILIFGDYDVDGVSATALVVYCLLAVGAQVNFYLPNRMNDGYGLSVAAVERAVRNGYSLIMTVDNGITAFDAARRAKECSIDLIITDHHRPLDMLPEAYAIVNPLQSVCQYPCKVLAGVGVAFKVISLLYERLKKQMPSKAYELLALGTIADVVPLQDENRFWVRYGLTQINRTQSLPITILKQNSMIQREFLRSLDIGFSLAPQINALGRMADPRQAVSFLIGVDTDKVHEVGRLLLSLNQMRKEAEMSVIADVQAAIALKKIDIEREDIIIAAHSRWPIGVIGLAASRLVNLYGKPTILLHCGTDGQAKGSGRSIPALNLFEALHANQDLLTSFGGHAAAVGLKLPISALPILKERLVNFMHSVVKPSDLEQKIRIDAIVRLPELTNTFMRDLDHLEPFGCGNEQPLFCVSDVVMTQKPVMLKDQHVKCSIVADGIAKSLIFFNRPELFTVLSEYSGKFDCAVHVTHNQWQGNVSIVLHGVDIARGDDI